MGVAVGGDHFEDAVVQAENGNVECSAAEIVNRDDSVLFFVETIRKRRGSRLVHQAENFEPGDAAGIFGGLALRVIEVCGNGNDRLGDRSAEEALGIALQLAQNVRRNLGRRETLVAQLDAQDFAGGEIVGQAKGEQAEFVLNVFNPASHEAFDRIYGALWSLDQIFAGSVADDDLFVFIERDHRRNEVHPVLARNYDGRIPLHERHQRVGGAEVDADDAVGSHECCFS